MEKINFETFKNEIKNLQGKTLFIEIKNTIETTKQIENAKITIDLNKILISNQETEKLKINTNYISNYYKENNKLICKLDNYIDIYIKQKEN